MGEEVVLNEDQVAHKYDDQQNLDINVQLGVLLESLVAPFRCLMVDQVFPKSRWNMPLGISNLSLPVGQV